MIFDVSTDRGIRSGNQTLTEIMYRLFLESLGYAKDLDLAELEIALEGRAGSTQFKAALQRAVRQGVGRATRACVAFAMSEASRSCT